ncbi:MAG: hypothetical protein ACJAZP_002340 [Psychromonas sp.]|jgi:hypothetical protein|uniref:hypothetical protein n=1 Tax=Psychromonas sp. TaxID=1884585 RepID=UPI0039E4B734
MVKLKPLLVYAIGLIAGTFCGAWASEIASDTFGIRGATFISDKLIVPTNVSGVIELVVIIVVFLTTVELVKRSGLLK